jgi:hypothetical protein
MTVVSAKKRTAPSGEIGLWSFTFDQRDLLVDLLDDMSPVLLRAPRSKGFGAVTWISLDDLVETPDGSGEEQEYRLLKSSFVSVAAPI